MNLLRGLLQRVTAIFESYIKIKHLQVAFAVVRSILASKAFRNAPYLQQLSEVGAAGRQDDSVSLQTFAITCQSDVDEIFIVAQVFERRCYTALVVVPT